MKMRAFSATVGFAVTALTASSVLAQSEGQPWLSDRRFGGGIGVRAGNFELHPGVAGELGYDTNFFQSAGKVTPAGSVVLIAPEFRPVRPDGSSFGATGVFNEPKVGIFRLRVTPSLTLTTLGPQRTADEEGEPAPPKVNLQASVSASYNELIATDSQYADDVADNRYISGDIGVLLDILPQRPWGLGLSALYNRSVQPVNDPAAPPDFARSIFRAGGAVKWRPGGGVLEWSLGYDLTFILFEDDIFSNFSSVGHSIALRGRWLFLPRTALLYTGEYGFLDYPDGGRVKPAGSPLSSQVGVNGLITNHFAALVMAGWKTLFFDLDSEFDSVVGTAQLTWYPLPRPDLDPDAAAVGLSSVTLGYRRDAQAAYTGNYVQIDAGYLKASYFFGGSMLVSAEGSLNHLQRPESFFSNSIRQSAAFSENRVNVTGFAEYRTSDTFGINTTLRYSAALTDQRIPVDNDEAEPELPYDDFAFSRFRSVARRTLVSMNQLRIWCVRAQVRRLTAALVVLMVAVPCWLSCGPKVDNSRVKLPTPVESTTLGPGDLFTLEVVGEKDLPKDYQVASDGTVDIPYVHRIEVQGLEPQEVARTVRQRLIDQRILVDPSVIVSVKEYNSKRVTVLGQVRKPGSFPLTPGMTLVQAISDAGGLNAIANGERVNLTRKDKQRASTTVILSFDSITEGQSPDIPLQAGDQIYVNERVF